MIRQFRNTIVLQGLYCSNSCNAKTGFNRIILNDKEHSTCPCETKAICFLVVLDA